MGDVIHTLPIVTRLHQAWPEAEIAWLIHPALKELLKDYAAVRKIIFFPREEFRGFRGALKAFIWMRTLREWKPDLAIDLQGLLRSALMARFSGASFTLGLSDAREGAALFYSSYALVDPKAHALKRYSQVLEKLAISSEGLSFQLPEGRIPADFSLSSPFVVIHPYARGKGKSLTREQVLAFAEGVKPSPVVLLGKGPSMKPLVENIFDWSGKTNLLELIGLLRHASFVVSSDSGPMHLAAALQPRRLVAIHRWSDPRRVGPYGQDTLVWKNGELKPQRDWGEEAGRFGRAPTLEEMKALGRMIAQQ